jgi:hypothetical protein
MATTATTSKRASRATTDVFTCPECGRTFTRPAALGAHRKLKHGVAGTSANASGNRRSATSGRRSSNPTRRRATTAAASNGGTQNVDRDALLRTLFPSGIPPRQELIMQVNAWLDEAERLARAG